MHMMGMYGLSQYEETVLSRLPFPLVRAIRNELSDPESREVIADLLHEPDPARAIVRQIVDETVDAIGARAVGTMLEAGVGKKKKKKGFKKLISKVGKVAKKIAKPLIMVAGAVLAPFTGGISLAASSALNMGIDLYKNKKAAQKAKKEQKKESKAMESAVRDQEAKLTAELNAFYTENKDAFLKVGYPPERWNPLSIEAKLGIIDKMSKGEMPTVETQEAIAPPPPLPSFPPPLPSAAPPLPSAPTPVAPLPEAPAGAYELYVEGRLAARAMDVGEITKSVQAMTSPGDRFEVFFEGESTGLKIRTGQGAISLPPDVADRARGMSRAEVRALMERSGERAEAAPTPSGVPWVPLAAAAAAAAVLL
jgi:hypothetical protein